MPDTAPATNLFLGTLMVSDSTVNAAYSLKGVWEFESLPRSHF